MNAWIYNFILENVPEPGSDAKFFTYEEIYTQVLKPHILDRDPDLTDKDIVVTELTLCEDALYKNHEIAVQQFAERGKQKGIRILNLN